MILVNCEKDMAFFSLRKGYGFFFIVKNDIMYNEILENLGEV